MFGLFPPPPLSARRPVMALEFSAPGPRGWAGEVVLFRLVSFKDGQHQDVDRTPRGRVSQNDRGQR